MQLACLIENNATLPIDDQPMSRHLPSAYIRMLRLEAFNHLLSVMADNNTPSTPPPPTAIVFSEHTHLSTPQSLGTAAHAEYHMDPRYVEILT